METSTVSRLVNIGLRAYGIWPYLPFTVLVRFFWVVILSVVQVFQYRYVVTHFQRGNFSDLMDGVSSTMAYSLLIVKLSILWVNQRTFFNILQMMALDWKKCVLTDCSLRITISRAKLSHRFSNYIIVLQLIAIILYCCGVLAVNTGDIQRLNVSAREHILKMKLPFRIDTSPMYVLTMVFEFIHLTMVAGGIALINSLIVILIVHIGGQIDILRDWLLKTFSKNVAHIVDKVTIKTLIEKHQQIIIFSKNIENLFTYIVLMLFVSDTLIICCLGFIIVTSIGTPNGPAILVRSVLFYVVINVEAFTYCFAGEYLNAKGKMIGDAAYDSLWYDGTTKKSRIVLFIILRSQKQLTITIGKIMDLSLERFASVVKASASYVSVLLAMN